MNDFPAPWVFLIVTLAAVRAVHFVLFDSLIGTHPDSQTDLSGRIQKWAWHPDKRPKAWWKAKLATLGTCFYCASGWVTLAAVSVAVPCWPWQLGWSGVLTWGASWSVACVLLALDYRYLVD